MSVTAERTSQRHPNTPAAVVDASLFDVIRDERRRTLKQSHEDHFPDTPFERYWFEVLDTLDIGEPITRRTAEHYGAVLTYGNGHWKNPIHVEFRIASGRQSAMRVRSIVRWVCAFYGHGEPTITIRNQRVRVSAPGYYATIGA